MKRLIIVVCSIFALLFFNTTSFAVSINYNLEGIIGEVVGGFNNKHLGWAGEPVIINAFIDSETPPTAPKPVHYTANDFNFVSVNVGGAEVGSVLDGDISYTKQRASVEESEWFDLVFMTLPIEGYVRYIAVSVFYPYCTFGSDFPVDVIQSLDLTGNLRTGLSVQGSATILYGNTDIVSFNARPVPEPATMCMLSLGLVGLAGFVRKKFKK